PPGAPGPADADPAPGRRGLRAGLLRRRRGAGPGRLRPARGGLGAQAAERPHHPARRPPGAWPEHPRPGRRLAAREPLNPARIPAAKVNKYVDFGPTHAIAITSP